MRISDSSNRLLKDFEKALLLDGDRRLDGPLYAGVDLGTAYIVTAVVDGTGTPVAGVLTGSQSAVRDGLVLNYLACISTLRKQVETLAAAGFPVHDAAVAYPPGTTGRNANAFGHVLESAGLTVSHMIDEPSAAAKVLNISDGAVVDIGGGTTGISVLQDGEVVYTNDEPTGGTHVDLVLSGHYKIPVSEAEELKRDTKRQVEIFSVIKPVFQKMGSIILNHIRNYPVDKIYLVGGTSCFPCIDAVIEAETGVSVELPCNPLLVTPLGIALSCLKEKAEPAEVEMS